MRSKETGLRYFAKRGKKRVDRILDYKDGIIDDATYNDYNMRNEYNNMERVTRHGCGEYLPHFYGFSKINV